MTVPAVAAPKLTTLYQFTGRTDGSTPTGVLLYESGMLYGTTMSGGLLTKKCDLGCGTVFTVDATTGAESVVYSFKGGRDGAYPYAGLIKEASDYYGTTYDGGNGGSGTMFKFNPATKAEKVIYSFKSTIDGTHPLSNLIYRSGSFYGTTNEGGTTGNGGTVFAFSAKAGERILHSFADSPDGFSPYGPLFDLDGTLYGTTAADYVNFNNGGTLFSVNAVTGAEIVVYSFTGGADGAGPSGGLTDFKGSFYSTTAQGGSKGCGGQGCGTVFKLNIKTGAETVLYRFAGVSDGAGPAAGLTLVDGIFYGTTYLGGGTGCGGNGCGTVFKLDPSTGSETVLYSFTGGADGSNPGDALIYQGGAFFGTTPMGGATCNLDVGCGTVFKLTP